MRSAGKRTPVADNMQYSQQQKEFLDFFEEHASGLFSYCSMRISSRDHALRLVERAFKEGWDNALQGKRPEIREFYSMLEDLIGIQKTEASTG